VRGGFSRKYRVGFRIRLCYDFFVCDVLSGVSLLDETALACSLAIVYVCCSMYYVWYIRTMCWIYFGFENKILVVKLKKEKENGSLFD